MQLTPLTAISSVDGRYAARTGSLREYFSEYGLIRYRVVVEIRWFQALCACREIPEVPVLSVAVNEFLEGLINNFSVRMQNG